MSQPEKDTIMAQVSPFSFLTQYEDSFNAVLGPDATLVQAQEVDAFIPALEILLREAKLRAERIVRQRGDNGEIYASLSEHAAASVKQSLGDIGEPRVAFHKLTGVLYLVVDGLPQSVIDWETEVGLRVSDKAEVVSEGKSLT